MIENPFLRSIGRSLENPLQRAVSFAGAGALPSAFAVTDLASASVAAAGCEIAQLGDVGEVVVDRVAASLWFATSIRPVGWELPPAWDAIAGDYETADGGFIRLHTNAPNHRAAALRVLGCEPTREAVSRAVRTQPANDLESAVVSAGGAAAAMRDSEAWRSHEQGRAVNGEALISQTAEDAAPMLWEPTPGRPLEGLRVLDLTRVLAGPVATRFLAGYGADVLRIDPTDWDEPTIAPDVTLGKRCARLDLRSADGQQQLASLLSQADLLVHGYRSDALDRLGFGSQRRRELSPGLVDVALDAYGWTGPWRARRGFDSLVQMSSGIAEEGMRRSGASKPTPLPVQALDHAAGYLLAAAAVRGVRDRLAQGRGSTARISLARVGSLLIDGPRGSFDDALVGADNVVSTPENTPYGPLRRLIPPLAINGVPCFWPSGATTLGSSAPTW